MSLYLSRYGESQHCFNRHDRRLYSIGDKWYFSIRRGYDQGPYDTEDEAHQALASFIQEQISFENFPSSQQAHAG